MIDVIATLKGGTGKSTITFNLSIWLATNGFDVRLFDLDPQQTLADVMEIRQEDGHKPLPELISDVSKLKNKDEVNTLVDVGTADMDALKQAIAVADRLFMPVPPSQADVWSTQRFMKMVKEIRGDDLPEIYAFINRGDTNPAIRETKEAAEALKMLGMFKFVVVRISLRTAFRRSFSEGLAVFEMDPNSKAASEISALATLLYANLLIHG